MNNTHYYQGILYKYRDWSKDLHKTILTRNEFFMASPNSFNDPFDCRIPENYYLLNTDKKIDQFMKTIELKNKEKLAVFNEESRIKLNENFKKRFKSLDTVQKDHEEHFFEQTGKCYGVFSLSKRWDSLLMWSHYSNNHKGFSIGFNEDKMRESNLFGAGFDVVYSNNFPIRNPLEERHSNDDAILQLGFKASEWNYEQEFRLINLDPNGISEVDRIIKFPDNFISELILGVDIPDNHKKEILEIAKTKKIKVFQLSKVPFKFKLQRNEII